MSEQLQDKPHVMLKYNNTATHARHVKAAWRPAAGTCGSFPNQEAWNKPFKQLHDNQPFTKNSRTSCLPQRGKRRSFTSRKVTFYVTKDHLLQARKPPKGIGKAAWKDEKAEKTVPRNMNCSRKTLFTAYGGCCFAIMICNEKGNRKS